MNLKMILTTGALLFSSSVAAVEWGDTSLTSGNAGFCFDITAKDIHPLTSEIQFRIYTKGAFMVLLDDQSEARVHVHTNDGSISHGPLVKSIGAPDPDRWQVGDFASFSVSEIASGTWRFKGRIAHGTEPFLPGDNIGDFWVSNAGGTLGSLRHLITEGCNEQSTMQPQPENVPANQLWSLLLTVALILFLGLRAINNGFTTIRTQNKN